MEKKTSTMAIQDGKRVPSHKEMKYSASCFYDGATRSKRIVENAISVGCSINERGVMVMPLKFKSMHPCGSSGERPFNTHRVG
jgi:hypothetical protein